MSIEIVDPYVDLIEFKDVAGIEDLYSDAEILDALGEGAAMIDAYCNRSFHLLTETRTFHAPHSEWLLAGDLQSVESVTWFGTPLLPEEYLLFREMGDYDMLMRYFGSPPRCYPWDIDPALGSHAGQPWNAILVSGVWAYMAELSGITWTEVIPAKVVRANTVLGIRLWSARTTHYSGDGGGVVLGPRPLASELIDTEVKDLLNPYIRHPLPRFWGSPYAD